MTRLRSRSCVDPVGETASFPFPSGLTPAVFALAPKVADTLSQRKRSPAQGQPPPTPSRPPRAQPPALTILPPHAAGIDVHADLHLVCVPAERGARTAAGDATGLPVQVRRCGANSCAVHAIADWLQECGITTLAMESTGVYWMPLSELLESRGFAVWLVDPGQRSRCGARPKTDVLDAQGLQRLHS